MPNIRRPRHGSMQFWHRQRAGRTRSQINHKVSESAVQFAGYKVGMTQVTIIDNRSTSQTKGEEIAIPVTVVECPPLKVMGYRVFKDHNVIGQINADQQTKQLIKRVHANKQAKPAEFKEFDFVRLLVHTQPDLTGFGQKVPDVFEIALSGKKEEQLAKAKELLGKEILPNTTLQEGMQVDVHSITKGKGYQGPVKRFGVALRSHKAEKTKRGPGSLGGWRGQGHILYRVAHAGQMGFHQRTELNKWVVKIGTDPKKINPKGGFVRYGFLKNPYVLIKGSAGGASKRLLIFTKAQRPNKKIPKEAPTVEYVSLESKQ